MYSIRFLGLLSMHLFVQNNPFFVSSVNQYSADFMVNKTDILLVSLNTHLYDLNGEGAVTMTGSLYFLLKTLCLESKRVS